eukprot:355191-Chlamydomonas_euryale.AAC.6
MGNVDCQPLPLLPPSFPRRCPACHAGHVLRDRSHPPLQLCCHSILHGRPPASALHESMHAHLLTLPSMRAMSCAHSPRPRSTPATSTPARARSPTLAGWMRAAFDPQPCRWGRALRPRALRERRSD